MPALSARYSLLKKALSVTALALAAALTLGGPLVPYNRNSTGRWGGDDEGWSEGVDRAKTARESPWRSTPIPEWTNPSGFEKSVFTFARVRYTRMSRGGAIWWGGGFWYSDYPDSDLNLSFRLQQLTAIRSDPNGRVIDLTDPELFDYPWIYIVEPGLMSLEDEEVPVLRKYLSNGGFLMVDDFWGEPQWANFEREMLRVFPNKKFQDLEMDHPIFHSVIDFKVSKNQMQIPNVKTGREAERTGITWERHEKVRGGGREDCKDVHFRALFDDKNRIMVMACYNTDNGDGWEREGEDHYFFERFSEKIAYPLAINIIFYSITH
jgi:ABC-type cobalt transport system substrate-binding protein